MRFDVAYLDPAWEYRNKKTGGSHTSGAAQKYTTIPLYVQKTFPLSSIMAPDSVCFLWATTPLGVDPYELLAAYGYRFKTKWYWHKTGRLGTGYWTRGCVEEVLIGVRGSIKAWRSRLDNWIEEVELTPPFESKPEGHSRKPDTVRQRIEVLTPGARRVELYATEQVRDWTAYGLSLDPSHDFLQPSFWEQVRVREESPAVLTGETAGDADAGSASVPAPSTGE
jgi:N6-adenosine-specific RNA methylase IME4